MKGKNMKNRIISAFMAIVLFFGIIPLVGTKVNAATSIFRYPLLSGNIITFGFGAKSSSGKYHLGIDYGNYGNAATNVLAIADGEVYSYFPTASSGGWGNFVILRHETTDGKYYFSGYGHMADNSLSVSVGDRVSCGTKLGVMGSTGNSTGPHVHLFVCTGISSTRTIPSGYNATSFSGTATKNGITYYNPTTVISSQGTCIYGTYTKSVTDQNLPTEPPMNAWVSLPNGPESSYYPNTEVDITFGADNATSYYVEMYSKYNDETNFYYSITLNTGVLQASFALLGHYSCYVVAQNSAGSTASEWIGWDVVEAPPTNVWVCLPNGPESSYLPNTTVDITFGAEYADTYHMIMCRKYDGVTDWDYYSASFRKSPTGDNVCHASFDKPGHYSCYIRATNVAGGTNSEWIGWDIVEQAPTNLSIATDTTDYAVNSAVNFTLTAENGYYKHIGIHRIIDSNNQLYYEQDVAGTSCSVIISEAGYYCANFDAINACGYTRSDLVYFTVYDTRPAKPTVTVTPGTPEEATVISWNSTSDTKYYDIYVKDTNGKTIEYVTDYTQTDYSILLDSGDYLVNVCACGYVYDWWTSSGDQPFTITIPHTTHTYELISTVPATCNEEGSNTYTCSVCGDTYTETVPALGHNPATIWTSDGQYHWHVCQNAGCTEQLDKAAHSGGEATCISKAKCETCGAEYGLLNPNNHKHTEIRNARAATEESTGYTGDVYCTDCKKVVESGTVIPKLDHTHRLIATPAKDATCTEAGNLAYWFCEKCGKYYADADATRETTLAAMVLQPLRHNYVAVVTAPTCTTGGYTTYTCSRCNDSYVSDEVSALGHNPATAWTSDGQYHWHACQNAGCTEQLNKTAHSGGEATCIAKAKCEVCGVEYGSLNPNNHKHTEIRNARAATETSTGYSGDTYCADCETLLVRGTTVPKLDHTHELTATPEKAATCGTAGNIAYWYCEKCGKYYADAEAAIEVSLEDTVIAALGHNFGAWIETTPATCTAAGEETKYCSRCDATLTHSVPALGHNYVSVVTAPTCTEAGYTTYTCSRCRDSYTSNEVASLGHVFGEWTLTTAPTCTAAGEETRYCSRCDATETRAVTALGHTLTHVAAVEATKTADGNIEYWKCAVCGKYFSDSKGEYEITADSVIIKFVPMIGDVNEDGKINARDIIAIMRYLTGWEDNDFNVAVADFDGNGKVNAKDVISIMIIIVSWIY